jgi:ATP-dependent Clp protease ATP-binding subunit ClpA
MAGWYLSEQARQAFRTARTLAGERHHTALGPPHLLAAVLRQWDDQHAGGPALLRACGLTAEQATEHAATLLHTYDDPEAAATPTEPRPNPALWFMLAQAHRIATETRAPYVGTEHLVIAMLWLDYGDGLRRQGVSYAQAAEQLAALPRTEQATDEEAIEPLAAVAVPTPAVAGLAELARQQAEQHPLDGRVSTLHYLLALFGRTGAGKLLGELGVSPKTVLERLGTEGTRLVEADDWRPEERPLEGWEQFLVPRRKLDVIGRRLKEVLWDQQLWQQGVRFGYGAHGQETIKVIIHPGDSGLSHQEILDRLLGRAS